MPKSSVSCIGSVCYICVDLGRNHRTVAGSGHVLRDGGYCVGVLLAWRSTDGAGIYQANLF